MGKTIKWLKSLFGIKKGKNQSNSGERKDKIPSCIGRSRRDHANSPSETPLVKPLYTNNSEDHNRRVIAVAAATVAVADAAVAAAQAAAAFVRLTTADSRQNSAAIKIQTLFRGYLSRKALKALKSLVKLQAVVRGYLVRKEAIKTLQGMEALFRARSSVFRLQDDKFHSNRSIRRTSEARSRRMSSSFQININERPKVDPEKPKSRLLRANTWAWTSDSSAQTPSPLFRNPSRLSIPNLSSHYEFDPHFLSTNNTPRFAYSCGPNGYGSIYDGVSKDDSFASHPGYMANTKSFRAKVRSQSAPKQRPTFGFGLKKRVGLSDVECGPIMVKSKSPSLLENSFKNCVMGRIGMSSKDQKCVSG